MQTLFTTRSDRALPELREALPAVAHAAYSMAPQAAVVAGIAGLAMLAPEGALAQGHMPGGNFCAADGHYFEDVAGLFGKWGGRMVGGGIGTFAFGFLGSIMGAVTGKGGDRVRNFVLFGVLGASVGGIGGCTVGGYAGKNAAGEVGAQVLDRGLCGPEVPAKR